MKKVKLLTFIIGDAVGGEVAEDLVRGWILPDPVFVLDDLSVTEPNLAISLKILVSQAWLGEVLDRAERTTR